ncbi:MULTISPECIES: J domain-containing protein [unclassified Streptomyces]|uniref:J domain-containing protein n=1 Tax=unclassified Streptomyces TaxID=2593676 RepID=UPI001488DFEC|nr:MULTISPECIES: J domain-containing protein [unclassified Streptomyces]
MAEPARDHYAVLGVEPTASARQITSAFRRLVRALHPDTNPDRTTADGRLTEVMDAYGTLHDPALRAAYDAHRTRRTPLEPQKPQGRPIPVRVTRTTAPRTSDLRASPPYAAQRVHRTPEPSTIWDLLWQWTNRW